MDDMNYVIGVDVGTTALKTVLFDEFCSLTDAAEMEYPTQHAAEGYAEQHADQWWDAMMRTMQTLSRRNPEAFSKVAAISISSQAPTMLPIDAEGRPLRPAMIWMDRRSERQCDDLRETIGNDLFFRITGNSIDPYYILPMLLWFRENEPELFSRTEKILQVNGYLNYRLTGVCSIDRAHAGLSLLYDLSTGSWSQELTAAAGIPMDLFPPIYDSHEVIGQVTPALSAELGFGSPPLVAAGTVDGPAAALESGTIRQGSVCEMTGTSTVLLSAVEEIKTNKKLSIFPHAIENRYLLFGAMSSTGAGLKWFRNTLGNDEKISAGLLGMSSYQIMDREVEQLPELPTGLLYLPYLAGERSPIWDSDARGVFFGLTSTTTRAQLIKSIMEGGALALKHNLEVLQQSGVSVSEIRSVGGGSKSGVWNQMKADITGVPIHIPKTSIGAPMGDAFIAGFAAGCFSNMAEAVDRTVATEQVFEPNLENYALYLECFELYKVLYLSNTDNFKQLKRLREQISKQQKRGEDR